MPFTKHFVSEEEATLMQLWCKELHGQTGESFVLEQRHFQGKREEEKGAGDRDSGCRKNFLQLGQMEHIVAYVDNSKSYCLIFKESI